MTTITVYDPPMCCSTGVCGADVDQRLVTFAADLDWLKSQGVTVRRVNLAQEPQEFVDQPEINELLHRSDGDALPAVLVQGKIVSESRYPSRAELSRFADLATSSESVPTLADRPSPKVASGCCSCSSKTGAASEKTTACC
jgi:hypothetical protein